jgi:hypothetical protein
LCNPCLVLAKSEQDIYVKVIRLPKLHKNKTNRNFIPTEWWRHSPNSFTPSVFYPWQVQLAVAGIMSPTQPPTYPAPKTRIFQNLQSWNLLKIGLLNNRLHCLFYAILLSYICFTSIISILSFIALYILPYSFVH